MFVTEFTNEENMERRVLSDTEFANSQLNLSSSIIRTLKSQRSAIFSRIDVPNLLSMSGVKKHILLWKKW